MLIYYAFQEFTEIEDSRWKVSVQHELDSIGYKYHYYSNDYVGNNVSDRSVIAGVSIFSKCPFADSARVNIRHEDDEENLIYTTIKLNNKPINNLHGAPCFLSFIYGYYRQQCL